MNQNESINKRILFGLKIKQLRTGLGMSYKDLTIKAGLSVSYLNEIEKGKKFPKKEKLSALAKALNVTPDEIRNANLQYELAPVGELLRSNFLTELPLDLFGIELSKVVEIIANAPVEVGAFITTLVELSRNYALGEEHFYLGALRSYVELHANFFPDIEQIVEEFVSEQGLNTTATISGKILGNILSNQFNYSIKTIDADNYPNLDEINSILVPQSLTLLLNPNLTQTQINFQYAKEIGFTILQLSNRSYISKLIRVKSFEQVLSHFKAGYFAAALIMDKNSLVNRLNKFFALNTWNGDHFLAILHAYQVSPETLFQRMTNVLPSQMKIKNIFFLRFEHYTGTNSFKIDKELNINHKSERAHSNGLAEHYCRRWSAISLLQDLNVLQKAGKFAGTLIGAQKATYYGSNDTYLTITLARAAYPSPSKNVSVTIGLLITKELNEQINFLEDVNLPQQVVNYTCERCSILDCQQRAAPPTFEKQKEKRKNIQNSIKKLIQDHTDQ